MSIIYCKIFFDAENAGKCNIFTVIKDDIKLYLFENIILFYIFEVNTFFQTANNLQQREQTQIENERETGIFRNNS